MALDSPSTKDLEKFWDLIGDNRTCMMVSDDDAEGMRARPMYAIPKQDRNEIWFYTRMSSGKSEELAKDCEVCITFANTSAEDYVSVTGRAHLSTDRDAIKEHWSRFVDAWFPEGPDGADVGMIHVKIDKGEFWDSESSSILAALKMVIASERDVPPDLGESRKIEL